MEWLAPTQAIGMGLTEELQKAIEAEGRMTPEEIEAQSRDFKRGLVITLVVVTSICAIIGLLIWGLSRG